ncbi:hypothetical protein CLOM_g17650 [Closterium sp. NIES-68]|nr:hypothetical protein CLOM_g17650 [Closterium sp. NIES-68]
MHGPKCRAGVSCRAGVRLQQMHLLHGAVFPVFGVIDQALMVQSSPQHKRVQVAHVEASDGHKYVGVHLPPPAVTPILEGIKKLKENKQDGDRDQPIDLS